MNEFENALIKGIHISRYIASWYNAGGDRIYNGSRFEHWLRSLTFANSNHLTEDEIRQIMYFASNGKMELEDDATIFMLENKIRRERLIF